jgi:hypothetical protein
LSQSGHDQVFFLLLSGITYATIYPVLLMPLFIRYYLCHYLSGITYSSSFTCVILFVQRVLLPVVLSIQMVYCVVSIRMVSCVVLSIKIVLLVFLLFIQVFQWFCLCYPISFTICFVFPCICVFLPIQVLSTGVFLSI